MYSATPATCHFIYANNNTSRYVDLKDRIVVVEMSHSCQVPITSRKAAVYNCDNCDSYIICTRRFSKNHVRCLATKNNVLPKHGLVISNARCEKYAWHFAKNGQSISTKFANLTLYIIFGMRLKRGRGRGYCRIKRIWKWNFKFFILVHRTFWDKKVSVVGAFSIWSSFNAISFSLLRSHEIIGTALLSAFGIGEIIIYTDE